MSRILYIRLQSKTAGQLIAFAFIWFELGVDKFYTSNKLKPSDNLQIYKEVNKYLGKPKPFYLNALISIIIERNRRDAV